MKSDGMQKTGLGKDVLISLGLVMMGVVLIASSYSQISVACGSTPVGNCDYGVYPYSHGSLTAELDATVSISGTIHGTSTVTGGLLGCSSGTYNWGYQYNYYGVDQNNFIQQIIEVNQNGNSCYTIEYYQPADSSSPNYCSIMINSAHLYSSGDILGFTMNSNYGSSGTIGNFQLTTNKGDYWTIYTTSSGSCWPNGSPNIKYDGNSQGDFVLVGAASQGSNYGVATFTQGSGSIEYCWESSNSEIYNGQYITAESSNMGYTQFQQSVCSNALTLYENNFQLQFSLTMKAGAGLSVTPSSGSYSPGAQVQISATSTSCHYYFTSWSGSGSGSYTGTNNPATITMNSNIQETANSAYSPICHQGGS
jgi:hypothetical protein